MERKYYLRGLGVGIAVTAIIMGIALSGDRKITDDEIIARAKELGMVENTVLTDTSDEEAGEENTDTPGAAERKDAALPDGQKNPKADDAEDEGGTDGTGEPAGAEDNAGAGEAIPAEADAEPEGSVEDGAEAEPAAKDNSVAEGNEAGEEDVLADTETGNNREIITTAAVKTITVNHGDGSYTVAKKLEDVGVVTSAATFDSFLCQNGYDKRLRTGTFTIPADASDEQIARIVTGSE